MGYAGELFCISFDGERIVGSPTPFEVGFKAEEEPTKYIGYVQAENYPYRYQLPYILIQILSGVDEATEEKREKVRDYARRLVKGQHHHLLWKGIEDIPVVFDDEW